MTRRYWTLAAAALAFCVAAAPADAAKKNAAKKGGAGSNLAAIRLACFKQYGGWYDPNEKKWVMHGTIYTLPGKIEAVNSCVAQKAGIPLMQVPFIQERAVYR